MSIAHPAAVIGTATALALAGCGTDSNQDEAAAAPVPVIVDTDAALDDAIALLCLATSRRATSPCTRRWVTSETATRGPRRCPTPSS